MRRPTWDRLRLLKGASRPPQPTAQTAPFANPIEYLNMNPQTSRKIIVASVMAAVVGIGVTTFALRSHPIASVAQLPNPPTAVTQTPAADLRAAEIPASPPPSAQIPDAVAPVAEVPEAPAAVAHHDSVGTNSTDTASASTADRKPARKQHLAKADTSAVASDGTVTRTGPIADTSEKSAAETTANSAEHVKSADELTATPVSSPPTDDQKAGTSTEFPAPDTQIPPN
jgi:hypothetical protein